MIMMKGDRNMVKRSPFGGIRKRLSDITNLGSNNNNNCKFPVKESENLQSIDGSFSKNYVDQLLKENAAMMQLIRDRDKIIESTEKEMQKLRVDVQKMQLQNWHLAQSNSQMLAELNVGKDRLKVLQHELACKNTLFKAKILELEEKAKMHCQTNDLQEKESTSDKEAADNQLQDKNINDNKMSKAKRGRPPKSRSMGPTTSSEQPADKEMAENKRRCLRRQSLRIQPQEEPRIDLFEINVANCPTRCQPTNEPLPESISEMGDNEEHQRPSNASDSPRLSLGRPSRRAVGKVQSYKEPPLNTKMRRST